MRRSLWELISDTNCILDNLFLFQEIYSLYQLVTKNPSANAVVLMKWEEIEKTLKNIISTAFADRDITYSSKPETEFNQ